MNILGFTQVESTISVAAPGSVTIRVGSNGLSLEEVQEQIARPMQVEFVSSSPRTIGLQATDSFTDWTNVEDNGASVVSQHGNFTLQVDLKQPVDFRDKFQPSQGEGDEQVDPLLFL
ncbi:unnamed protein product [Didymodactylos carnosus]|uniref:Uncharacterized protein n=1 Tax=Didymodactylos carnosus TaxID=1234261 RepID=A0A8S2H0L2_9BILA|nr:unnamed protein product [Didymodactylos carnosus]CAF3580103.1 unnamed protein product [Didymodactylos carnosus]